MFDWTEYLDFARVASGVRLPTVLTLEAVQRSAISRAYYSAWHAVREYGKLQKPPKVGFSIEDWWVPMPSHGTANSNQVTNRNPGGRSHKKAGSHECVIYSLEQWEKRNGSYVVANSPSALLFKLKNLRRMADYDDVFKGNISSSLALAAKHAEHVIQFISRMPR